MATLLVTYDLNKSGQNYTSFLGVIKKYTWARLSESSYAIQTYETPQAVYNNLSPYIDKNDNVYIIALSQSHYGQGPQEVNNWLSQHL